MATYLFMEQKIVGTSRCTSSTANRTISSVSGLRDQYLKKSNVSTPYMVLKKLFLLWISLVDLPWTSVRQHQ